tara:strand:+ start:256 stop:897 length:642 start_codon:yes stop_codon:yes gene_type:complete
MKNIKTKIDKYGEVFTSSNEVNGMLDIVDEETRRLDSTFLEPACGDGNFLTEVLDRKLKSISSLNKSIKLNYQIDIFIAVSSLYGIDIQKENISKCQSRLFKKIKKFYENKYKEDTDFFGVIKFLLSKNITWGDALTLKLPSSDTPIIFSKWSLISKYKVKRLDYSFKSIINNEELNALPLFSDLGELAFIPEPIAEFDLIHFLKINKNEKET